MVRTRDNNNSKTTIRKDTNQEIPHNPQLQIHRKRNSQLNVPSQQNDKLTFCLQRNIYIQRKYTKTIAINGIRLVSKYESQSKKCQTHRLTQLLDAIMLRQPFIILF